MAGSPPARGQEAVTGGEPTGSLTGGEGRYVAFMKCMKGAGRNSVFEKQLSTVCLLGAEGGGEEGRSQPREEKGKIQESHDCRKTSVVTTSVNGSHSVQVKVVRLGF